MKKILLAVAVLSVWASTAEAQNAVTQAGTIIANRPAKWKLNRQIGDSGGLLGDNTGIGMLPFSITDSLGCGLQFNTATTLGTFSWWCLGHNSAGQAIANLNGIEYQFPVSVGGITGPVSTIVGNAITWNNTSGTLVKDAGAPPVTTVQNNTALKALTGSTGVRVVRAGFATPGDGGAASYTWGAVNCVTPDDGGRVQPTTTGCWQADFIGATITPQIWGAKGDGTTDDSPAVQAAVSYLCTNRDGGTLKIPASLTSYRIHDISIPCGLTVIGDGMGTLNMRGAYGTLGDPAGTTIDCTSMTAFCFQWRPATFPSPYRMAGGSIEKIRFTNAGGTGYVLKFYQSAQGNVRDVMMENAPNGIYVFGAHGFNIHNVAPRGTIGNSIEITGDTTGYANAGGPCVSVGDCSTRGDLVTINGIFGYQGFRAGAAVYVHDSAFTTVGNNIAMLGGAYGLRVDCAAGKPNVSYCPQQLNFRDFESEFSDRPFYLTDFTRFVCDGCYGAGGTDGGVSITENIIYAAEANYTQAGGGLGGVQITNGQFYAAKKSCIFLGVSDTQVSNTVTVHCNLDALEFAGIEYDKRDQHSSSNNNLCHYIGTSNTSQWGLRVNVNASVVTSSGDGFQFCAKGNVKNDSSLLYSVVRSGENPPPAFGTISAIAGCGAGCTVTGSNGNEYGGLILITAGSAAGASGQFTLSFREGLNPAPLCLATPLNGGSGTWDSGATFLFQGNSPISGTFFYKNAAVSLVNGSSYFMQYKCSGF